MTQPPELLDPEALANVDFADYERVAEHPCSAGAGSAPEERVGGQASVRLSSDAVSNGLGRFRVRLS